MKNKTITAKENKTIITGIVESVHGNILHVRITKIDGDPGRRLVGDLVGIPKSACKEAR